MPRKTQPLKASKAKKQPTRTPVADPTPRAPPTTLPTTIKLKITLKSASKVQGPLKDSPSAETPTRNLVADAAPALPTLLPTLVNPVLVNPVKAVKAPKPLPPMKRIECIVSIKYCIDLKRFGGTSIPLSLSRTRESIEVNSVYLTPIMWNTKLKRKEEKKSQTTKLAQPIYLLIRLARRLVRRLPYQ